MLTGHVSDATTLSARAFPHLGNRLKALTVAYLTSSPSLDTSIYHDAALIEALYDIMLRLSR